MQAINAHIHVRYVAEWNLTTDFWDRGNVETSFWKVRRCIRLRGRVLGRVYGRTHVCSGCGYQDFCIHAGRRPIVFCFLCITPPWLPLVRCRRCPPPQRRTCCAGLWASAPCPLATVGDSNCIQHLCMHFGRILTTRSVATVCAWRCEADHCLCCSLFCPVEWYTGPRTGEGIYPGEIVEVYIDACVAPPLVVSTKLSCSDATGTTLQCAEFCVASDRRHISICRLRNASISCSTPALLTLYALLMLVGHTGGANPGAAAGAAHLGAAVPATSRRPGLGAREPP